MIRDIGKPFGLILLAVAIGVFAWSGDPLCLPLAMLFPALWALSPTRLCAILVSAGYFLAASRGLPQGVANFYGAGLEAGIALWVAASLIFAAVHAALWTKRTGWRKMLRYGIAAVLMSVPPIGIVGWAHPITAAGVVFPGWGWVGLAAAAIGLLAMTTRHRPIAILTLGGLWIWSAATWTEATAPGGWVGVDTAFRGSEGQYAGYDQQLATIGLVQSAAAGGAKAVALPESALGALTPTVERLWSSALADHDVTVIAGAIVVDDGGYDNVMVEISDEGTRILYRQRMPVPVSMWQPWRAWIGQAGGANAHFFHNAVVESAGMRFVPLICYEQLIVWPFIQSVFHGPDVVVAIGNGWWTSGTSIVAIQRASIASWARLFDLNVVYAFNT